MFRKSGFLAIALSAAAIGSAIAPATAFPLQVFGGANTHLSLPFRLGPSYGSMRSSPQASHLEPAKILPPKIQVAVGSPAPPPKFPHPVTPQCGAGNVPALAAGIDELLPTAQLSKDDITKVTELRQMVQDLSTDGKVAAARNAEEVAMYYLGYQKVWLRCGAGTFDWEQVASNDAGQSK